MGKLAKQSKLKSEHRNDQCQSDGERRVFLMRHGQGHHNLGEDVPDALLTDVGCVQARAWKGNVGGFRADVILMSPLRRAVQTALLAFDGESIPLEMCRHARELWWDEKCNTIGTPKQMRTLLQDLPRGSEVQLVEEALIPSHDDPETEGDSIVALQEVLESRPENVVVVVCHYGVIMDLCGASTSNCDIIECVYDKKGRLQVKKSHRPPNAPRTC